MRFPRFNFGLAISLGLSMLCMSAVPVFADGLFPPDLSASAEGTTVTLTWNNPGGLTASFMIRRSTSASPTTVLEGTLVTSIAVPTTTYDDSDLDDGTYYYSIFALDISDNASSAGSADAVTVAVCGSGIVAGAEECDDSNTTSGDGCSNTCTVETNWSCLSGSPSVCTSTCAAGVATGAHASKHYGTACYAYYNAVEKNYDDAESSCEEVNGTLAVVTSSAIQSIVSSIGSYAWIGLGDSAAEGTFIWENGATLDYSNWADDQPNGGGSENCVRMENGNLWHDYPCGGEHTYLCTIPDAIASIASTPPPAQQHSGGRRASEITDLINQAAKRFTGYLSSASSISSTAAVAVKNRTALFDDVWSDDWFGPFVQQVVARNLFSGYTDTAGRSLNRFGPGDPLTYGQLAKVAVQLKGTGVTPATSGHWATPYLVAARSLQLSVFHTDINPDHLASRGAVIHTLLQTFGISVSSVPQTHFSDLPSNHLYASDILTAVAIGIMSGDDGASTVRPDAPINRAEFAKIIATASSRFVVSTPPASSTFSSVSTTSSSQQTLDIRTVQTSILHVRADARIGSTLLWDAKKGMKMQVLAVVQGDWAHIRMSDGKEGYVWVHYLD